MLATHDEFFALTSEPPAVSRRFDRIATLRRFAARRTWDEVHAERIYNRLAGRRKGAAELARDEDEALFLDNLLEELGEHLRRIERDRNRVKFARERLRQSRLDRLRTTLHVRFDEIRRVMPDRKTFDARRKAFARWVEVDTVVVQIERMIERVATKGHLNIWQEWDCKAPLAVAYQFHPQPFAVRAKPAKRTTAAAQ